ncbi:MAG: tetratricopeptide repeat protein, partial [Verrucomicrobiota bacterium]
MKPLVFAFSLLTIVAASTKATEAVKLDFDYDSFWKRIQSSEDETKALQLEPILLPRLKEEERDLFKELLHFTEELKDSQSALKLLETSITQESSAVLYYFAANLYTVEDNIPKAVECYLETLERHPTFAQAIKNVSVILAQSGYHREAIPFLSRAIELGVNDSQTWGLLGFCQVNVNENTAAEKSYRNAIIYDSTVRDWKLGLARSLLASQKYNEAISILQEILIDTPDDDIVLSVQADAYIALDRPNDAAGNYALIHRLGKANAQYLVQLGSIYLFNDLNEMGTQTIIESLAMPDSLAFSDYSGIVDNLILRGSFDNATKLISSLRKHKESDSNESLLAKFEVKIALGKGEFENLVP